MNKSLFPSLVSTLPLHLQTGVPEAVVMVKGSMECGRVDGSWLMYGKTASVEEGTDLGMVMMYGHRSGVYG